MSKATERFSNRVADYVKYRPGYPPAILALLRTRCGLKSDCVVADIGSGTGKLTDLFLQNNNPVFAVEPNSAMRTAAEHLLAHHKRLVSVGGSAEETNLNTASVDFITAGQAFHWFDRKRAKAEFARILKPGGWVVLIWNERKLDSTPFLKAYEKLLLDHGTDYKEVRHENVVPEITEFFAPKEVWVNTFENKQAFDFAGLRGRVASSSYTPHPGTGAFDAMLAALKKVFDEHAINDRVTLEYDTRIYYGQLS